MSSIEVLFLVAFYGIRCTHNLDILRRVCKTLRDRIDRDILREVIAVNHVRTNSYNRFQSSRHFFPHQNVIDSMKSKETFHVLTFDCDKVNVADKKFLWDASFVEMVEGDLLISFEMDHETYGFTSNGKFEMEHKQIPEDSFEPDQISLYARKRAKIQ